MNEFRVDLCRKGTNLPNVVKVLLYFENIEYGFSLELQKQYVNFKGIFNKIMITIFFRKWGKVNATCNLTKPDIFCLIRKKK